MLVAAISLPFLLRVILFCRPDPSLEGLLGESLGGSAVLLPRRHTRGRARLKPALTWMRGQTLGILHLSWGWGLPAEPSPSRALWLNPVGPRLCPRDARVGAGVLAPLLQGPPFGLGGSFENHKTLCE